METTTIYIQLLEEGTACYRPTEGEKLGHGLFRVLPTENYDPEDEHWEFPPGTIVRVQVRTLHGGVSACHSLVAMERAG